ncbi:hypothetical protein CHI07_16980 [Paenibacillus sp. 7884-2]|nr:hypothetical protein CHI07_16980 [Paenibacillus sp. 7884-2]
MKWTDEAIKNSIFELANQLGIDRMPTNTEMRDSRNSGLSRAIGMNGGTLYWSEKTGLPMKNRAKKWTNDLIEKEINDSMNVLCITRMPTASELMSIGRNDLHCAISKGLTYREWANKLEISMKESETTRGQRYERLIEEMIVNKGHEVESMTTKHPFDLLVNGNVKVDVKMGVAHNHFGSRAHTFRPSSKYSTCDIYVCQAIDEKGVTEKVFVIPSKFAQVETLNIGMNSKYNKFIDRWDFIEEYTKFYDSVAI